MTIRPFLHFGPPQSFSTFSQVTAFCRRLWDALHAMRLGKIEATGEFTLTANATTTVLNRKGLSPQTVISWDPKSANAAAELAAGTMYILTANRANDAFTVTHANAASTDRTFQYSALG